MELSEFTVRLIILFIPGIIGTIVYSCYENRGPLDNRSYFINTLIIGVVSYFITYLFRSLFHINSVFFEALFDENIRISIKEIIIASGISVILGIKQSIIVNRGWLYKCKLLLKITTRIGHVSVWDEVFDNLNQGIDKYIYIKFPDYNLIYAGNVDKYSMQYSGKKELYLKNVVVYNAQNLEESTNDLSSVYLQLNDEENIIIEFKNHNRV